MKKLLSLIIGSVLVIGNWTLVISASADDFEPADEEGNSANTYILDSDDTGGDVILQFGASLAETLTWDDTNSRFNLSDDFRTGGDLEISGTNLTLDADNTGSGVDVDIIANQGSDSDGTLRYNSTLNQWEYSNDGGAFTAIGSGSGGGTGTAEYFDAYDSAGVTNIPDSPTYVDIPLGTQRKITTDFTHSAGSAEVTINTSGTYLVHYAVTTDITSGTSRSQTESRLMIDTGGGYALVPGSYGRMYNKEINEGATTAARNLALDLASGDKLKIQATQLSGTSDIVGLANGSALTIARVEGIGADGADGADGAPGADGADGAQGIQGIPGSGSSITLEDEGSTVTNTPHTILNFVGTGVTVADAGSGEATITISGGSSSDEFEDIYSNDTDNTLTTSDGVFTINTGTNDFIITSNDWGVDASGNITTSGTVDGVDVAAIGVQAHSQNTDTGSSTNTFTLDADNTGGDVILRFGTVLAETLRWDNANTRFTFTDSLRIEGNTAIVGQPYIADDHAATDSDGTLNLGINGSAWENLTWNDTNDQFELSDDISIGQNQIKDVAIDNLASAPGTPVAGQIYHNTTDNNTYIYNGTSWEDITAAGGAGSSDGWHGSTTRIKITPMDFQSDDGADNNIMDASGRYIVEYGTASPVATIAIPTGYRATHVMIYGSDTGNTVTVYTNDISDNTTATSLGSGNIGTEIDITDNTATTTNYITVSVDYGNGDQIFGGYITITAI